MNEKNKNPWTPEDEREHESSVLEWWCPEAFFKTIEDNKKWHLNAAFSEGRGKSTKVESLFKMTLFDQDNDKYFKYLSRSYKKLVKEKPSNDGFDIRYNDSYMEGLYPDYEIRFNDLENDIILDFKLHAKSMPHWVAQDITDGWLPLALGFYRYGFIPKMDLSGTMNINDRRFKIKGVGYFEHVWGDFSYYKPLSVISGLKKSLSTYSKLIGWWLKDNKIKIPRSITFSSENNPLGYDWVWAVLDNGWTIFYGNIMFWVMKGPATGTLILSKDDKTYQEWSNISFRYTKMDYGKNYDFYYPTELEITARKGKEKLHLRFTMTNECREYVSRYSGVKYWLDVVVCEAPGTVQGYYFDGEKKIKLSGFCKIEPQRQITVLGHNSLKIDFLLPPDGLGCSLELNSHFLRKKIFSEIQLAPRPKIRLGFNRIDDSKLHVNKR